MGLPYRPPVVFNPGALTSQGPVGGAPPTANDTGAAAIEHSVSVTETKAEATSIEPDLARVADHLDRVEVEVLTEPGADPERRWRPWAIAFATLGGLYFIELCKSQGWLGL